MNISGISENGLKMLHESIRNALEHDDALPAGQEKTYGVREHKDWREFCEQIEADLDVRSAKFTKISW